MTGITGLLSHGVAILFLWPESGRLCSLARSRQPRPSAPAGPSRSSRLSGSLVSQNYEYFHLEGAGGSPPKNGSFGWAGPHGWDGEVGCSGLTSAGGIYRSMTRAAACRGAPPGFLASFLASVASPLSLDTRQHTLPPPAAGVWYAAPCVQRMHDARVCAAKTAAASLA